ncbi:MAG: PLP-dependent aminotransferase family protein [Desulfobacterales bacterium]|nr:PLP-dependent aminotransferase family protein [Desulfobacterales bacterium]
MIVLKNEKGAPLYLQIYEQVKDKVISGNIRPESRMPSIRAFSDTLGVSKNTVTAAYQQLCDEGYLTNRSRSGFYVRELSYPPPVTRDLRPESTRSADSAPESAYDFRYGGIHPGDFPINTWRRLSGRLMSKENLRKMVSYPAPTGEPGLKQAIGEYLANSRGVSCLPEQIVICSGTQQCLDLVCCMLKKDHTAVAMEDPGYDGARVVFRNNGFQIVPIPVESGGIRINELEKISARLLYVTPSRQFPTGEIMPIRRRIRLLEWAAHHNAVIIEDDYDSEFRYTGKPIPAIQGIDSRGHVIYTGTFSRSLSPALRMSYMVIPLNLMETYRMFFRQYHTFVPWTEQAIVETFIREGHWDRHLRRLRLANKRRHDTLMDAIDRHLGDTVSIIGRDAGLHVLMAVRSRFSERELLSRAEQKGVILGGVERYWIRKDLYTQPAVLVGYSGVNPEDLEKGIHLLKEAWNA